jgi:predicted transcriptional regulator
MAHDQRMELAPPCTTSTAAAYYNSLMASVRLDEATEIRLARAARLRGQSKSDFIREAIDAQIEATLAGGLAERLAGIVGAVDLGGGRADRAHEAAGELIRAEHESRRPR